MLLILDLYANSFSSFCDCVNTLSIGLQGACHRKCQFTPTLCRLTSTLYLLIAFKQSTEKYKDRHSCSHKASAVANPFSMFVMVMMGLQDLMRWEYLCYMIQNSI